MSQRKPRKGDRIGFGVFDGPGNGSIASVKEPTVARYTVTHVEDNLCWIREDGAPDEARYAQPFIWNFPADSQRNRLARIFGDES